MIPYLPFLFEEYFYWRFIRIATLDYLVGKADKQIDQALLDKVLSIQQFPNEDREHIMYAVDGLIQHAKTRIAYKK